MDLNSKATTSWSAAPKELVALVEILGRGMQHPLCARNADDVNAAVEAISAKALRSSAAARRWGWRCLQAWIAAAGEELGGLDAYVSNVSGSNAPGDAGWRAFITLSRFAGLKHVCLS